MASRDKSEAPADEWRCPLCKEVIRVGEMFTPIAVRAAPPANVRMVPCHYACTIETIADQVADRVEEMLVDEGAAEEPAGGDLRQTLQRAMKRHLGGFVDDIFRGG